MSMSACSGHGTCQRAIPRAARLHSTARRGLEESGVVYTFTFKKGGK